MNYYLKKEKSSYLIEFVPKLKSIPLNLEFEIINRVTDHESSSGTLRNMGIQIGFEIGSQLYFRCKFLFSNSV